MFVSSSRRLEFRFMRRGLRAVIAIGVLATAASLGLTVQACDSQPESSAPEGASPALTAQTSESDSETAQQGVASIAQTSESDSETDQQGVASIAPTSESDSEMPPPGEIRFVAKNKVATANTIFRSWKFTKVEVDAEHPEKSVIELEVDIGSVDTGIKKRDNHLLEEEFFHTEKYPTAALRIYDASPTDEANTYAGKMDMEIRGVKKTFDLKFSVAGEDSKDVSGKITLKRTDFGVGEPFKSLNPMSIEDEIPVTFTAHLP